MKVKELIEQLSAEDPDTEVQVVNVVSRYCPLTPHHLGWGDAFSPGSDRSERVFAFWEG